MSREKRITHLGGGGHLPLQFSPCLADGICFIFGLCENSTLNSREKSWFLLIYWEERAVFLTSCSSSSPKLSFVRGLLLPAVGFVVFLVVVVVVLE